MRHQKIIFLSILLFLAFFADAKNAKALDVTATSLSQVDVQTAVNQVQAAGGGTVYLPAGTSPVWTSSLYVPGGVNIIGAGSPMTTGGPNCVACQTTPNTTNCKWGPEPTTILQSNVYSLFSYNASGHSQVAASARVANIKFIVYPNGAARGFVSMKGIPNGRIDHCIFDGTGITINGRSPMYQVSMSSIFSNPIIATTGVIDHCNFVWGLYGVEVAPRIWIDNKPLGMADDIVINGVHTQNAVVVEDCSFEDYAHPVAGFNGAHWVYRYNYLYAKTYGYSLDAHGPGFVFMGGAYAGQNRGTNVTETYMNTLDANSGFAQLNWGALRLRSGKGVVWGNTFKNHRHALILTVDPSTCTLNGVDAPNNFYIWSNTLINVVPGSQTGDCDGILAYKDGLGGCQQYIDCNTIHYSTDNSAAMPGYTPYTYPHPLTVGGAPTPDTTPPAAPSGVTVQ